MTASKATVVGLGIAAGCCTSSVRGTEPLFVDSGDLPGGAFAGGAQALSADGSWARAGSHRTTLMLSD